MEGIRLNPPTNFTTATLTPFGGYAVPNYANEGVPLIAGLSNWVLALVIILALIFLIIIIFIVYRGSRDYDEAECDE